MFRSVTAVVRAARPTRSTVRSFSGNYILIYYDSEHIWSNYSPFYIKQKNQKKPNQPFYNEMKQDSTLIMKVNQEDH